MKYIAYGSNMRHSLMVKHCPNAKLLGIGHIEQAVLEFYHHATVQRSRHKDDRVPAALWEINPDDELCLDLYEGVDSGYYAKETWTVRMNDGSQIEGLIYIMRQLSPLPPAFWYFSEICQAYTELGFNDQINTILKPALLRSFERVPH